MSDLVIHRSRGVRGEITPPGDKSLSHRAVMFSSIAEGTTEISGFLAGEDTLNTAEKYERLGDINLTKGDITASFVNYSRALQMEPERLSVSYKMGRLFLYKGMTSEARREFEKIIKKDPKNALAHEGMGRAYLLDKDNERAVECLARAARVQNINDRRWEVHDLMGIAYDRQKKYSLAIEHYRTAISIKPDAASVYNNLGISYYMSGEYSKAKVALTTAIEKGEDGSRVYNNLAVTLSKLGEYRMARAAFNKAGSEAMAQNNIGNLYLLDGKNKEAAAAFEKAIELDPAF
jgi:Flp pilus assembly protein TadD